MTKATSAPRSGRPGGPVRGSTTGLPIMALFDLLGRRWALTTLWALRDGPKTFRQIQALDARISPSSLNKRLAEFRQVGLVARSDQGYLATPLALELLEVGAPLAAWADRWADSLDQPD